MVVRPYTVLGFCAGVGGLELGIQIARPGAHGVVYIEREAHAAEVLAARMEDGALSPAPIWGDAGTFDPRPWRGLVDCVASGDPCQPNSVAGKRKGADDERWLIDQLIRVVDGVRPGRVFRENVTGNADGQLAALVPALEGLGYRVAAGIFSSAAVGFSHRRERLVIMADRRGGRRWEEGDGGDDAERMSLEGCRSVVDSFGPRRQATWRGRQVDAAAELEQGRGAVADASGRGVPRGSGEFRAPECRTCGRQVEGGIGDAAVCGCAGGPVGYAGRGGAGAGRLDDGQGARVAEVEGKELGSALHRGTGRALGNPDGGADEWEASDEIGGPIRRTPVVWPGVEGGGCVDDAEHGHEPVVGLVRTGRDALAVSSLPLGAPGPNDPRWGEILDRAPLRSPAISDVEFAAHSILVEAEGVGRALTAEEIERVVRRVDARMAYRVDRLRECGNGVSSLAVALAWRTLETTLSNQD